LPPISGLLKRTNAGPEVWAVAWKVVMLAARMSSETSTGPAASDGPLFVSVIV